jgi:tetratricopeptide (TPR) repeat protein
MKSGTVVAIALAFVSIGSAKSGAAEAFGQTELTVAACTLSAPDVEAADKAFVEKVHARFEQKGADAIAGDVIKLQDILRRHADRHRLEKCGENIIVNSGDIMDSLFAQADMVGTITKSTASKISVVVEPTYLITAASIAGFMSVENHDMPGAIEWLAIGLQLAPHNPSLASEAANALNSAGRYQDALDLAGAVLDALPDNPEAKPWRAALLRRRGFAFGEMQRWAEARQAYEASLKYTPGNANALNELDYINKRAAGAPASGIEQTVIDLRNPPKARDKLK